MASEQLVHDVALVTAQHILGVVGGCLREEEQADAFDEIYARVKAGLECFEIQNNRRKRQLAPGRN
jgi:hypothetical protein